MSCRHCLSLLCTVLILSAASARAAEPTTTATATNRLPEVLVTSTRLPELLRPIEEVPAHVSVITQQEIADSPAFTPMEILRQKTGIAMTDTVGLSQSATKVTMRGYSDKPGTLILVDGVRVSDAGDNSFLWNSIPVENIERIEVIRGGASTIYGEGAVAGVINIITKQGAAKPFTASLTGAVGNLGFYSGHGEVAGRLDKFDYLLSLDRKEWDGWRESSAFRSWSVHAKPSFETAVGRFTLSYQHHWSESEDPTNLTAAQYAANPRQKGQFQVFSENEINRAHLAYEKKFDTDWALAGRLHGQTYDSEIFSTGYGGWLTQTEQPNYGGTFQVSRDAEILRRDNQLVFGVELIQQDFETRGNGFISSVADHWTASGFVQDTFRIVPQLALEVGTRFDHRQWDIYLPANFLNPEFNDSRDASVWSPKAALTWNPVEKTAVWISVSRSFRLPGGSEIGSAAYDPGYFILGNPDIEPVDARTIEIGTRCDRSQWLGASLAYYYSDVRDDIVFDPFFFQNQNFDSVRQGVELELRSAPASWLDLYFNTAFVNAEFDGGPYDGNKLPHVPQWQLNGGATVRPCRGLALTLEATHVRDQVVLNDLDNVLPENDYTVVNAKGSYRYRFATLFASVNNLLDHKFELFPTSYGTTETRRYNPAPGVNFQVGATLQF